MTTYWLHWKFDDGKFDLIDWQHNELAEQASMVFWPSISVDEAQGSVLYECHKLSKTIERDITHQNLPHLDILKKLPFKNVHIKASIGHNGDLDIIRCVYTVGKGENDKNKVE